MRLHDITRLVDNTLDAAFAVDVSGLIVAWSVEAEALFGVSAAEALEQPCGPIIQGTDESGRVCSEDCTVRQAAQKRKPLRTFDLQVQTAHGRHNPGALMLVCGASETLGSNETNSNVGSVNKTQTRPSSHLYLTPHLGFWTCVQLSLSGSHRI